MSQLASAILKGPGKTLGENNHPQYNDSGASASATSLGELKNRLVLFNSKLVRNVDVREINRMLDEIILLLRTCSTDSVPNDMFVKLMVLAAYQRDIKDGKGERDIFYHVVFRLWKDFPAPVEVLLRSVIGSPLASFKDVLLMIEKLEVDGATVSEKALSSLLFSIMLDAAKKDRVLFDDGKKPETLVFKWMPRQQTHFDKTLKLASRFARALFPAEGDHKTVMAKYRRMLSAGSKLLETVEFFMCGGQWTLIDPAKVPAKAMKNYRKAFMNVDKKGQQRSEDPDRKNLAEKLLAFIASGKSVHGATLMPHEIIRELLMKNDPVLEAQLTDMVAKFISGFSSYEGMILPLSDVSDSMTDSVGCGKATCMDVSIALGFLLSQLPGPFHDKIMTFHDDPRIYDISGGKTYYDKLQIIRKMSWGGSTNFEKAMDHILRSLIDNKVDPTSVSNLTLIVFSDMQFNETSGSSRSYYGSKTPKPDWNVAHDRIEAMYKDTGFPTPSMVYWNLNARDSAGHPAHAETKGVTMLSGFSQAALKTFLAGELIPEDAIPSVKTSKDPYEVLCTSLEKYIWLMKKFEEAGVFPGFVAPVVEDDDDTDTSVAVASVTPALGPAPAPSPALCPVTEPIPPHVPVAEDADGWVHMESS